MNFPFAIDANEISTDQTAVLFSSDGTLVFPFNSLSFDGTFPVG